MAGITRELVMVNVLAGVIVPLKPVKSTSPQAPYILTMSVPLVILIGNCTFVVNVSAIIVLVPVIPI